MDHDPRIRDLRDLADRGFLSTAYEKAERLLAASPDAPVVGAEAASLGCALHRLDEAAERYASALRCHRGTDEDRAVLFENLAFTELRRWRLDEAGAAVRDAIRLAPEKPGCRSVLGDVLRARGDSEGAFEAYRAAAGAEEPPLVAADLIDMARIRRAGGRHEEALELVRRALPPTGSHAEGADLAADLEEYLREAPGLPGREREDELLTELFSRPGHGPSLTVALAERCIRFGDAPAAAFGFLARGLHRLDRFPEARAVAERIPPDDRKAGTRLALSSAARAAAAMGDLEDARNLMERAIELSPMITEPYVILGAVLLDRGRFEEAEAALRRGMTFEEPNQDELFYNLARTLRGQRRYEEAVEFYERALELDPEYELVRTPLEDVKRVIAERS